MGLNTLDHAIHRPSENVLCMCAWWEAGLEVKAVNSHRTHEYYRRKDVVLKFFYLFFTILKNFIEI